MNRRISLLLLPMALSVASAAFPQAVVVTGGQLAPTPSAEEARARLAARWAQVQASGFSGAVRIDIGGTTLLRSATGFADPVTKRPFTPDAQFEIGSLTKAFTAAAILKLQDEGKLSVQDPLSKFFPGVPADKAGITLHQLLIHAGGFPLVAAPQDKQSDLEPVDRAQFLARAFATPLQSKPGEKIGYTNSGYGILAAVIEVASGQSYEAYLKAHVLAPAGIKHIGYRSAYDANGAIHNRDGQSIADCCWGPEGPHWNLIGNGGLVSTLDDFVAWREAFIAGKIVSPAAVQAAGTGWIAEANGPGREGYGWIIAPSQAHGEVQLAAGGNRYFVTEMRYYPRYGIVTLVTGNGGQSPGIVAAQLVQALFGEPETPAPPPGTPAERELTDAFAAALLDNDAAARAAFLEAHIGPVFRQRDGMPAITQRFDAIHAMVAGAKVQSVALSPDGGAEISMTLPNGQQRVVRLRFGGSPMTPRVAGFDAP